MMHQKQQTQRRGGAEVRKIHLVYFLSRNGTTDHPHLMRVHHRHCGGGVRLSDVKRWLSELRGEDMPDSYAWAYKRQYKTGYVWQDLVGNDLITPVFGNEYVLKGSFISTMSEMRGKARPFNSKKPTVNVEPPHREVVVNDDDDDPYPKPSQLPLPNDIYSTHPPQPPSTTYVDASTQTSPRDATPRRATAVFKFDMNQARQTSARGTETGPEEDKKGTMAMSVSSSLGQSKSSSGRKGIAAYVFRNLITCGDMETCDSATIMLPVDRRTAARPEIHQNRGTFGENMARENGTKSTACPLGEPYCSQCGKAFKPEKLHAHMKSCKALKSKDRKSSYSEKASRLAEDGMPQDTMSSFLMAH